MDTKIVPVDSNGNEIAATTPQRSGSTILAILDRMAAAGVTVEAIERVAALYERQREFEAKAAFADAVGTFQAECPVIPRESKASFVTKSGSRAEYTYAELDTIVKHTRAVLAKNRLSYSWDCKTKGGVMECICTLTHGDGHTRSATFEIPVDGTQLMSAAQKHAGTLTYAKRQALQQVLGIVTGDRDSDGADDVERGPTEPCITEDQAANIDALIDDAKANRDGFLRWVGVSRIADIPASRFKAVIEALEKKRGGK